MRANFQRLVRVRKILDGNKYMVMCSVILEILRYIVPWLEMDVSLDVLLCLLS